ncbi:AraC family transcriptional regulator [Stappia sp. P2PMeth1]|uniref:helix-turn-helix transcriptional regulator n=1 Tax=Stappia sp. P2PMeth1 TaxID=2003586 RepID=UPI001648A555|nr:AraC family transcriptional regulator [Stappia sp. P2PMeth1]
MGVEENRQTASEGGARGQVSGADRLVFSSDDFGPDLSNKARLTLWHDIYTQNYGSVQIDWRGEGTFRARSQAVLLEDAVVGRIDFMFHSMARTKQHVANENRDDIVIGFMREAPVHGTLEGREIEAPAGSAFLLTTAEAVHWRTKADRIAGDTLVLPRAALAPMVGNGADLTGRLLDGSDPAVVLLARYVELVLNSSAGFVTAPLKEHIRHTLLDLAAIAVGAKGENALLASERGQRAARLAAVKADVRENIGRWDLSVQAVAARHGITPRYLHVLFESEGRTFSEFVALERLAKAYRYLTGSFYKERRISEIAFATGFADLSTFNRQFKRQYGMTPSEAREAALRG